MLTYCFHRLVNVETSSPHSEGTPNATDFSDISAVGYLSWM